MLQEWWVFWCLSNWRLLISLYKCVWLVNELVNEHNHIEEGLHIAKAQGAAFFFFSSPPRPTSFLHSRRWHLPWLIVPGIFQSFWWLGNQKAEVSPHTPPSLQQMGNHELTQQLFNMPPNIFGVAWFFWVQIFSCNKCHLPCILFNRIIGYGRKNAFIIWSAELKFPGDIQGMLSCNDNVWDAWSSLRCKTPSSFAVLSASKHGSIPRQLCLDLQKSSISSC